MIERAGEGGYGAWCPDLPSVVALADTEDEVLAEMRRAVELHLAGLRADGHSAPVNRLPLAQIRDILALDPASAAAQIRDYWARTEMEHAAQRELVDYLVDRLYGKKPAMYDVAVRDIPERSLLSLMRRAHQDEVMQIGREFFIRRMARGGVARVEGITGAPFTIYYGEVSGDSDGPVEFCWPVPGDQAAEIAARFPDLTLRTEPAHQEAFVGQDRPGIWDNEAEAEIAIDGLVAWASEQQRETSGGVRMVLVFNPANQGAWPDTEFAVALR